MGPPRSERAEEVEVSQAGGTRDTESVTGGTSSGPAARWSPRHSPGSPVAMAPWLPTKEKYGVGEWGLQALQGGLPLGWRGTGLVGRGAQGEVTPMVPHPGSGGSWVIAAAVPSWCHCEEGARSLWCWRWLGAGTNGW